MRSTQPIHPRTLARLNAALDRLGIQQKQVAEAAGVSKFMVSHVLSGRAKSARVVATVKRLIDEAKSRTGAEAVA